MKIIAFYWGYLVGEEHLTDEQFAEIDFGNPQYDNEFITFDPLASSFFQGKYYFMIERKLPFPHRKLPSMRVETMVMYDEITLKIINPPVDLEAPVGIFICIFIGKKSLIKRALDFLGKKLNIRFSPCELDLLSFYEKISKTRLKILPTSLVISNLDISELLTGNLEIFPKDRERFIDNLKLYKPKNYQIKLLISEINIQVSLVISLDGTITYDPDIERLTILETIIDIASRSIFTSLK